MTMPRERVSVGVVLLVLTALAHGTFFQNNVYSVGSCSTSPTFSVQQLSGACVPEAAVKNLLIQLPAESASIGSTQYVCGATKTLTACTDNVCSAGCGTSTPSTSCSGFNTGSANAGCVSSALVQTKGFYQSFYTDSACATTPILSSFTAINTCIPAATSGGYFLVYSNGVSPRQKMCTDNACTSCSDNYLPSTFGSCLSFGSTGLFTSSIIVGATITPSPSRTLVSQSPTSSITGTISLTGSLSASTSVSATGSAAPQACYYADGVDLPGNDLASQSQFTAATALECCELCQVEQSAGCHAWTHDPSSNVCVLKTGLGSGPVATSGLESGAGGSCGCVPSGLIVDSAGTQTTTTYVSPVSEEQALGLGLGLGLGGLICIIFTCLFLWFCLQRTKAKPTAQYGPQLLNTPADWDYEYYDDDYYYSGYSGYNTTGGSQGSQGSGYYNYYSYYSDDVIPGQGANPRQLQAPAQQQQQPQQQQQQPQQPQQQQQQAR